MAKKKSSQKDKREPGGYAPMAYVVLRSDAYARLSPHGIKLLNDLLAQYRGNNNGDLCIAWKFMKKRYWRSKTTLYRAKDELIHGNWIEVSRQGGRHQTTLYALTFFNVDDCKGKLDIDATSEPKSTWKIKNGGPPTGPHSTKLVQEVDHL